jgi:hypothetical protein
MRALALALLVLPSAAFAGDKVTTATDTTTETATAEMGDKGTPPPIFKHGTLGLSFSIPSDTQNNLSLTYFTNDKTALDLLFGFDLAHTPATTMGMMMVPGGTTFGLTVGLGYRMYKHHSARIHSYLEPFASVSSVDLGSISDNLALSAGGVLGAECMFTDWFSVRGQVGVELTVGSTFKAVSLATATSGLFAAFYWD